MSARSATCVLCAIVALSFSVPIAAQDLGTVETGQHGAAANSTVIPATDLTPRQHSDQIHMTVPGYLKAASGPEAYVYTSLHLEPGIEVTRLCARVYDTDSQHELIVQMGGFESGDGEVAPAEVILKAISTGVEARPGYALLCADLDPPISIRTVGDLNKDGQVGTLQYWVGARIPACDVMAGPIILNWHRPVSPPPVRGRFSDVGQDHKYFRFIEALAAAGVTAGCGGGRYCPEEPITRGEVAVFLASALSLYWPN
jgi:hypothetical protein